MCVTVCVSTTVYFQWKISDTVELVNQGSFQRRLGALAWLASSIVFDNLLVNKFENIPRSILSSVLLLGTLIHKMILYTNSVNIC